MQPNPCRTPVPQPWHPNGAPSLPGGRHLDPSHICQRHPSLEAWGNRHFIRCKDLAKSLLECLVSGFAASRHICTTASPLISHRAQPRLSWQKAPLKLATPNQASLRPASQRPPKCEKMSLNATRRAASPPGQPPNHVPFPWCPQFFMRKTPALHPSIITECQASKLCRSLAPPLACRPGGFGNSCLTRGGPPKEVGPGPVGICTWFGSAPPRCGRGSW